MIDTLVDQTEIGTENTKLSDLLEQWYIEHPEEWVAGCLVRQRDGDGLAYCITGKAAHLLGVPVIVDEYGYHHPHMPEVQVTLALNTYAQSHGCGHFPDLFGVNDWEGFWKALGVLRYYGL